MYDIKVPNGEGVLTAAAVHLYGRYACGGGIEATPEHAELCELGLVVMQGDRMVLTDPQVALRRHGIAKLAELRDQAARIAAMPAAANELTAYFQRGPGPGRGCEYLDDRALVNARIQDAVSAARTEILAAQPGGPRTRELMNVAIERDTDALHRGVTLRTLYGDSVRHHPVTREWAQIMSAQGAAYRTLAGPFQRCIIVDGQTAFIEDLVPGAREHAGWKITDRAMVAFVAAEFEDWWRRAEPWQGWLRDATELSGVRTTRVQREILRDTIAGITQQVTAGRLGISVRSLQRQLDQVREMWGVTTLAQLGYHFALSPDHQVDDQPVDTVTGPAPAVDMDAGADAAAVA